MNSIIDNDEFFKHSDRITYPIAGALVEYIITFYGMDKFKKLYLNEEIEFEKWIKEISGDSLEKIEEEFIEYLDLINLDTQKTPHL